MPHSLSGTEHILGRFGKVLGAIVGLGIGLAFSSLFLALLLGLAGLVAGHLIDSRHADAIALGEFDHDTPKTRSELEATLQDRAIRDACALFIALARLDGEVFPEQIRAARAFFEALEGGIDLDRVRVALKEAIATPRELLEAASACQRVFSASERLALLSSLYEVTGSRGLPSQQAISAIRELTGRLGLTADDLRRIASVFAGELAPHFETLGLTAEATDEEVKRAYRRLASEHHPDRVAHLGPKATEHAAARFREIDAAYEAIRRARGL